MVKVNIKEFMHNFSKYKERVKKGERIVILERNKPIMDLTPYDENVPKKGWMREHFVLPEDGTSLTETLLEQRAEERG